MSGWQGQGAYYGQTFGMDFHNFEEYAVGYDKVFEEKMMEVLLDTHREYLPRFFG